MHLLLAGSMNSHLACAIDYLNARNFNTMHTSCGRETLLWLLQGKASCLIINPGVQHIHFLDLIRKVHQLNIYIPIIVLSSRSRWQLYIEVFEAGADIHLTLPCSLRELERQILGLFSQQEHRKNTSCYICPYGELCIHPQHNLVWVNGIFIKLNRFEFDLLRFIIKQLQGRPITYANICRILNTHAATEYKDFIAASKQLLKKLQPPSDIVLERTG